MGNSVSLWTLSFKLLSTPNFGDHFAADDTLRKTDSIWTKMDDATRIVFTLNSKITGWSSLWKKKKDER